MATLFPDPVLVEENSRRSANAKKSATLSLNAVRCNEPVVMQVSSSSAEREQALQLVQKVYCRSGLTNGNASHPRVMRQHLAEETEIIVGKRNSKVVFTVTLVGDGKYGMPLQSLFAKEVGDMRQQKLRLAEVSCLAHDSQFADERSRFETFVSGISLLLQVARDRAIDRLLLAVHPRHAKVYERLLGCVRCSDVREYAAVSGNPAVLCMHDFAKLDQSRYPLYNRMYALPCEPWQLRRQKMSELERQRLERFLPEEQYEFLPMAG